MAEEHKMGTMDISQHKASYNAFMKMAVWGSVSVAVLLALMAIFLVRGHH
jgi:hypothetical protein